MKAIIRAFFLLISIAAIALFFVYSNYKKLLDTPISGNNNEKKVFVIEEGLTASEVLTKLNSEDIINDKQETALKVYLKFEKEPEFKKGTFKFPLNISLKDLITTLENPDITDIWITIPEGLRKDEIGKIIAKEYEGVEGAVFSENEFTKLTTSTEYIYSLGYNNVTNLEGYLFPDKYLMPAQATTDYIIRTLVKTFKEKTGTITKDQLIIASMIEREGLSDIDRPGISDVIRKRLEQGWLLQIDATLLYFHKDWKHTITLEDTKLDHPYNTYKKIGLPPTPICNPGISAINAAKNPKKNNYYYYIHDNNGNVYFATTLAEHEANIFKYLR
jgi:UPF0755 protein